MAQLINEAKRFQQLAGISTEDYDQNIVEGFNIYLEAIKYKYKVLIYTGADLKFYNTSNTDNVEVLKSMKDIKKEHFKDVEKYWEDCDLLIYTSTLTAGVSFEKVHFDINISYLYCG